jgi:hypothetical protein
MRPQGVLGAIDDRRRRQISQNAGSVGTAKAANASTSSA